MTTENLSTLKIHKLTQEQYNQALAAGNIESDALYLTPDNSITTQGGDVVLENSLTFYNGEPVQFASGHLVINNSPDSDNGVYFETYGDGQNPRLQLNGWDRDRAVELSGLSTPTLEHSATTKEYVDNNFLPKNNDIIIPDNDIHSNAVTVESNIHLIGSDGNYVEMTAGGSIKAENEDIYSLLVFDDLDKSGVILRGIGYPQESLDGVNKAYVDNLLGDIETTLDNIIEIQNSLIYPNAEGVSY